jgi:hypothetical protein
VVVVTERPTAWWWLRRDPRRVGGYGETHGVVVVRPTAWWWLRRDPRRVGGYGETHGVVVVTERPTAWLFSQICNHRGQPPPRRDPHAGHAKHEPPRREARATLPCRSQRSGGGGAFRSARWFLVAEICGGFWLLLISFVVVFGCSG